MLTTDQKGAITEAKIAALERCFLVPVDDLGARTTVMLRVAPTRNSHLTLVNWADDYRFDATLQRLAGP